MTRRAHLLRAGGLLALLLSLVAARLAWRIVAERDRAEKGERSAMQAAAEARGLVEEAARADRFTAERALDEKDGPAALAHLARAIHFLPRSTLAAEKAMAALNTWSYPVPLVVVSDPDAYFEFVEFSPDGSLFVTSNAGIPQVRETSTGKLVAAFAGQGSAVSVHFSPDGTRLVTASHNRTAQVWEAVTGKLVAILSGHEGDVHGAWFSPDGALVVTASKDTTARVWEAATGKLVAILSGHINDVTSAQFSADGARIVTASVDKTARVWEAASGKSVVILSGHDGPVVSAQFNRDGERVLTASRDDTVRVWTVANGDPLVTFSAQRSIRGAQFSPDGMRVVIVSERRLNLERGLNRMISTHSGEDEVCVWKIITTEKVATFHGHTKSVSNAQFSPDGTRLLTVSDDQTARVWEAATGQCLATLSGHEDRGLRGAQFSPDGTRIITATREAVRIWDASPGRRLTAFSRPDEWMTSAHFSPDGRRVVTASHNRPKAARAGRARVWDPATGELLAATADQWRWGGDDAEFSPNGALLVTASGEIAQVWEAKTGRELATLSGHEGAVRMAHFSPDGARIVTAARDGTARVWETATGKLLTTLSDPPGREWPASAQFSRDGARVVTALGGNVARVWETASGKLLATLSGHEDSVNSAEFSPDAMRIVTASGDKTARLWDAATGQSLAILADHESPVSGAHFSPDGGRILTFSIDMRVWEAATGKLLVTINPHVHLNDRGERAAQFSPDGTRILDIVEKRPAQIWDAATGELVASLVATEDHEESGDLHADFSPDGTRVVTACFWDRTRVWTILPPTAGAPPEWFPDFLHFLARKRLNAEGDLEDISAGDWLALRQSLRAILRAEAGKNTPYLEALRFFVTESR